MSKMSQSQTEYDTPPSTGCEAVKETWPAPGRLSGVAIAAAPTIGFVIANALGGLVVAIITAALAAIATVGVIFQRGRSSK
jgi:hypothetical protein